MNRIGVSASVFRQHLDGGVACTKRSGDGYLLTRSLVNRDSRTGLAGQRIAVLQHFFLEARQYNAVQVNHIKERIRRSTRDKTNRIFLLRTRLGSYRDALYFILQHAQHTLRLLGFLKGHRRNGGDTLRQRVDIIERVRTEARDLYPIEVNHQQVGVARGSYAEVDDISAAGATLRTNGNLIIAVQTTEVTHRSRLQVLVHQLIRYCRTNGRSLRQVHIILIFLCLEALDQHAVQVDTLQRVIAKRSYGEGNLIDRRRSVAGRNRDTGLTIQTGSSHRDRLVLIARDRSDLRQRGRSYRQRIGIGRHVRIEALQVYATDLNTLQRRALGFLRREDDLIYRLVTVAGRNRHTYRSVNHTGTQIRFHYFLILVADRPSDIRQGGGTQRQVDVVGGVRRLEILDIIAYFQVLEVAIRGSLKFEVQFINLCYGVTRRGDTQGVRTAVDGRRSLVNDGLLAVRIRRDRRYGRHRGRARRQRHFIHSLRRREARNRLTVHLNILQRVIGQFSDFERQVIRLLRCSVRSRHGDRGFVCQRSRLAVRDGLLVLLLLCLYRRNALRTVRQLHLVVIGARAEVRYGCAHLLVVNIRVGAVDIRQLGVATLSGLEQDLIGHRARAVLCLHHDGRRRTAYRTVGDSDLATRQLTSREVFGCSARVG